MQTAQIDQQLAPSVTYLAALLRGGYSVLQSAERMAEDGPQPLAAVFRRLADDLRLGIDSGEALGDLQRRFPSPYLGRVIGAIARQRRRGGNLAEILEPLGAAIAQRAGSEGATAAQRARLAQLDGLEVDWAAFEPRPPRPWAPGPPVVAVLEDPEVSEVLIDGPYHLDVVRRGRLEPFDGLFLDAEELLEWVRGVVSPFGHQIDEAHPLLNLRLPDDSTISVIAPPLSPAGAAVVVRKAPGHELAAEDLPRFGAASEDLLAFLRACVVGRVNIVVAGGAASGKTTLVNILCGMIPEEERVITVEATRELRVRRRRLLALEAGQPTPGGPGVGIAELLGHALLMLPERLVVGELRGPEVLPLARAINAGHPGALASLYATSPRDAVLRLEQMAAMAEPAVPLRAVRHELASAIQLIVQINRMADGVRRITAVAEVAGMEGETIALREIFRFAAGEGSGAFVATGHRPAFLGELAGYALPQPGRPAGPPPPVEGQLAELAALAAALLRAGYSFTQSLAILAEELPDPAGGLLASVAREVSAGVPLGEALDGMARQAASPGLQLVVGAILRQRSAGGNLADGLDALVEGLRRPGGDDPATVAAAAAARSRYGLPVR